MTRHPIWNIGYSKCMIVAFLIQHPTCNIGWSACVVAFWSNTLYYVYETLVEEILYDFSYF